MFVFYSLHSFLQHLRSVAVRTRSQFPNQFPVQVVFGFGVHYTLTCDQLGRFGRGPLDLNRLINRSRRNLVGWCSLLTA